ncbi:MAG: C39 family peptidase [Lachnospiraceae bacterium]|nr:C39 family peptidase [Lachnospiraceae bacterium]
MKNRKWILKWGHVALLLMFFLLVIGNIHPITSYADPPAQIEGEWIQSSNGRWWYRHTDGSYTSDGWEYINGYWYHFDSDGWMQTGWLQVNSTWYYLSSSGAMVTGWQYINNYWYYFSTSGSMCTGWLKVNNVWYYLYPNGTMCTGWEYINGSWYYFNDSGAMRTDDLYTSLRIYSFDEAGHWISTRLRVTRQQQQKSCWCWAASAVMVGRFNTDSTKTQSEVVYHIKHSYDDATGEDWEANYALYYASDFTKFGTITDIGDFPYSTAVANIDDDKPFIVKMLWNSGNAHMVAGAGYRITDSAIYLIDPASNCSFGFYKYSKLRQGTSIQSGTGKWIMAICYSLIGE